MSPDTEIQRSEITIPVKCSTMRKWYNRICVIKDYEIVAIAILTVVSVAVDFYMFSIYDNIYFLQQIGYGSANVGCILFVIRFYATMIILMYTGCMVVENLPDIKCIEDEPEYNGELEKDQHE